MTFATFATCIVKIANLDLPGEASHYKMAPIERLQELTKQSLKNNKAKKAAVMVLFYPNQDDETLMALILRNTYKGVHSAQVGLPGGKQEPSDISTEHTALRETHEEIGVLQQDITVLKNSLRFTYLTVIFLCNPLLVFVKKHHNLFCKNQRLRPL